MRLIDADALIEEFEEYEDYVRENSDCFVSASETSDVVDYLRELAMRMPTVEAEPVVHGERLRRIALEVMGHQKNYSEDVYHMFSKGVQALVVAIEKELTELGEEE